MKLFLKFTLTAVVLAVALPFFMFGPDGGPLIQWRDVKTPPMPKMPDVSKAVEMGKKLSEPVSDAIGDTLQKIENATVSDVKAIGASMKPVTTYRWKDAQGVIHFSDKMPPDGVEFTTSTYVPQKSPERKAERREAFLNTSKPLQKKDSVNKKKPLADDIRLKDVYSVENVQKLVQDAKQVKQLVEERYQNLEK